MDQCKPVQVLNHMRFHKFGPRDTSLFLPNHPRIVQMTADHQWLTYIGGHLLHVRPSFLAAPQSSYLGVEQDSTGQEIHHAVLLNARFLMHNPVTGQPGSISGHAQVKFLAVPEAPQAVWNVEVPYVADAKIQDPYAPIPTLSPLVLDDSRPLIDLGAVANFQCSLLSPSPLALDPPETTLPSTALLPAAAVIGDTTKLLRPVSVRYRQPLADGESMEGKQQSVVERRSTLPPEDKLYYWTPLPQATPVRVKNWLHSQSSLPDPDMPELESVSDSDYQSGTELRPVNRDSVHGTSVSPQAYDSEDIASSDEDGEEPSFNGKPKESFTDITDSLRKLPTDPHSAADISVLISDEASSTHGTHSTNGREDFAIVNTHEILEEINHVRTVPATATGSLLQDREVALCYTVQWAGTIESDREDVLNEEDTDGLKPLEDGMHILAHRLNHTLDHSTMLQEDVGHLKHISDMPRQTGEDYARISPVLDLGSEMVIPGKRKHSKHKQVRQFNQSALQKSPIQLTALKIEYMRQQDDISGYTDVRLCILEAIRRLLIITKHQAYNLDLDTLPNTDPEFPPLPYLFRAENNQLQLLAYAFCCAGRDDVDDLLTCLFRFRHRETNSLLHMLHAGLLKTLFPVDRDSVDGSESELSDDDNWYPGITARQDQEQFDAEYTAPSRFTIRAHHPLADGSRHSTSPMTPGPGTTVVDPVPKSDGPLSPTPTLSLAIESASARAKQLATTQGANTQMLIRFSCSFDIYASSKPRIIQSVP
ncbi:hypothetical protein C8J57DRAFT_1217179 [Mycena rebaudengoi]|nr:hypothetical protein C8J57DRAFT_1217179 [Mycena rebaudengoi]